MAELFLEGDWSTANSYYNWPFYPLMIAGVSKLTFLDVGTSAYVLNTFFCDYSCHWGLLRLLVSSPNNDRKTLLIAALVILLFPSITKYRAYIIRDFAYLSPVSMVALLCFFAFCYTRNKKHLLGWLITTSVSCLFRFEGIILLFVAPYFLLVFSSGQLQHRRKILTALSVVIVVAATASIYWYLEQKYASSIKLAQQNGLAISNIF